MKSTMNMLKNRIGIYRLAAILLLIGIVLGTVAANILQRFYLSDLETINRYFGTNVNLIKINYGSLMKYIIANRFKEFILIWISCCMVFGMPLLSLLITYKGICIGFALSSSILCYGFKGIIVYFAYIFPQCIIYIPVYILLAKKGYDLCETLYFSSKISFKGKKSVAREYVPIILILFLFLCIGCIIETYINSALVRNVVVWVMKQ